MAHLKDVPCAEGISAVSAALARLTVLNELVLDAPMQCLARVCDELANNNAMQAAYCYHALSAALIKKSCRRVSGDAWLDYLLSALLETPNAFSEKAACGVWDDPLSTAMRYDLTHMGTLAQLSSSTLKRWIGERFREVKNKPKQARDTISLMSNAVWTGNVPRNMPQSAPEPTAMTQFPAALHEETWLSWRYGTAELEDNYVSDGALEEIYHRLLSAQDWGVCLDDIWNFHNSYGTGAFVRYRLFSLSASGLQGMDASLLPAQDPILIYEVQQETLMHNAIRFMRGERSSHVSLSGAAGTGKTTQVYSIARELPEVRLIIADLSCVDTLIETLPVLRAQPLKFILFVDDADITSRAYRRLRSALSTQRLQNANLLLIIACENGHDSFAPLWIDLPCPQIKEFVDLVQQLLLRESLDVDFDSVRNACIDRRAAGDELTFHTAYQIVDDFLRKNIF